MTKELTKEAFSLAEKERKEKQIEEVKKIVLKTLEKIEQLNKDKEDIKKKEKDIDNQIKVLKMDIDDLKEGRLDRIEERQEKDMKAKETSVVIIIKEKEVIKESNPWSWKYNVYWPNPFVFPYSSNSTLGCDSTIDNISFVDATITNSVAKNETIGTYIVGDKIINLR